MVKLLQQLSFSNCELPNVLAKTSTALKHVLTTEVEMDADNYAVYQYWQQMWRWMQITMQCISTGNRCGDGCR